MKTTAALLSPQKKLNLVHNNIKPRYYHVESAEVSFGEICAEVINEADDESQYHFVELSLKKVTAFALANGLNIDIIDYLDASGEYAGQELETPIDEYMEDYLDEAVTKYLNAKGE
jgi:hypothetical protein